MTRHSAPRAGRYGLILALALGLLAAALGPARPGAAQVGAWPEPVEVSQPPLAPGEQADPDERRYGSSWFSDLAVLPDGSPAITWYSGMAAGNVQSEQSDSIDLLMFRTLRDGEWSPLNEIAAPGLGGFTVRNSLASGRDGRLHAVYRAAVSLVYSSAPADEAFSALAWSEPRVLSDGSTYYNDLAADGRGFLHAFWSEALPGVADSPLDCLGCADLFYRRSTDGGASWEPAVNLSQTPAGDNRPQVVVDAQDRIHLTWDEGADWYAGKGQPTYGVYRRSDDGGQTWSDPVRFELPADAAAEVERTRPAESTAPAAGVQQTALAVDGAGNPMVIFRGALNDRIYYARSADGGATWSAPAEIPGILARSINDNNLDIYALAFDGAGVAHALAIGFDAATFNPFEPRNPWLFELAFDEGRWSAPIPVHPSDDLYPEYPRLVIHRGNQLHASWFTRSSEDIFNSERARYRVWYSRRDVSAPALPPAPTFTPVPTAGPTVTPAPTPSPPAPTPLPDSARTAPPVGGRPAWEGPGLRTVGLALVPPLLIVAAVVAVRVAIIRRRDRP